ncbi:MAG: cation:proton antiporter [Anaeromyxobacter sp.]|nr:cation:proton antiporter [Anaeromyxobacter sp.]MBL0276552.1 cation:proton antiporter [Anaeromyxobacter sp.]
MASRLAVASVALGLLALVAVATRLAPEAGPRAGTIAAIGLLLLVAGAAALVTEPLGVPHLTAFLLTGVAVGPHGLGVVGHQAVEDLQAVNALALALIALAGGAELRLAGLRAGLRGLGVATLVQNGLGLVGMAAVFAAARPLIPFAQGLEPAALAGAALLWGAVAVTRSPSALLGVVAQTRARGPLTSFSLNFVMTSDVVVVVVLAVATTLARPLLEPGAAVSLASFGHLADELVGSVAVGTTLGLGLALYLWAVGRHVLIVLVALGLVFTHLFAWLSFEWLLVFIVAGFVVQNLTSQGKVLLHEVERTGEVVYVIFFATAGAHLDLGLLAQLWPAALLLAGARAALAVVGGRLSSRLAGDPPVLARWGFAGLVPQAGLALGIASQVTAQFPQLGTSFGALVVAVVAVNELAGPVLLKVALDRAGETAAEAGAPGPAGGEALAEAGPGGQA